ncbi:hypothetical protein Q7O_000650 [Pectobacterium carotovorum subsp. carotovorum PCCS1]|jgi:hypothetical protein|nr:hypothetical protein [Pectobacterium carotovorum subsp. carotovorum PCCS1]
MRLFYLYDISGGTPFIGTAIFRGCSPVFMDSCFQVYLKIRSGSQ